MKWWKASCSAASCSLNLYRDMESVIKTTTETEGIKQTRAADCKWIWLHKELIRIWCSTLIALKILKCAHRAGNQLLLCRAGLCRNTFRAPVKVHNNVRWVGRTMGIHEWPLMEATLLKLCADWTQQVWKVVLWGGGAATDPSDSKAACLQSSRLMKPIQTCRSSGVQWCG